MEFFALKKSLNLEPNIFLTFGFVDLVNCSIFFFFNARMSKNPST